MAGSLPSTQKKKFRMYTTYSIIIPLILSTSMIVLDNVLDEKSSLWPGIGEHRCWFKSHKTEFLFFHGPTLFLLMTNIIFFTVTIIKMKRESSVLKKGMPHDRDGSGETEDNQRLVLYVKLFLLMGGAWLMEILSWSVGGPAWIWYFTDVINCSHGVLIFYLCVWSNKKVRISLLSRVSSKYVVGDTGKSAFSEVSVSRNDTALVAIESGNRNSDESAV